MRFGFDSAKQASNLKKHGFDLAEARQVIESGQTVTFEDRRFEDRRFVDGEERFVTLGTLGVIVTAETEHNIRTISMRKADRHEQTLYRENKR